MNILNKIFRKRTLIIIILLLQVILLLWLFIPKRPNTVGIVTDQQIDITPERIQSIKEIGEWEFLSISDEQLIDTVRKGFFSDDQLIRIYYGTLRLGVNMHLVEPGWVKAHHDSITLTLPAIGLLDNDFIDDARTRSFIETGKWSAADREALYKKAYRQMKRQCLTPHNIQIAEENAQEQLKRIVGAMGYSHVEILFQKTSGSSSKEVRR